MDIEIVLPPTSDDQVSTDLVWLTERLHRNHGAQISGGVLGGEFGYGAHFENDTFRMHPYCWCEKDECSWCNDIQLPHFWHKPTDSKIWWYKWIGRGMEIELEAEWREILKDCLRSLERGTKHEQAGQE